MTKPYRFRLLKFIIEEAIDRARGRPYISKHLIKIDRALGLSALWRRAPRTGRGSSFKLSGNVRLHGFRDDVRTKLSQCSLKLCHPLVLNYGDDCRCARREGLAQHFKPLIREAGIAQLCRQAADQCSSRSGEHQGPGEQACDGPNDTADYRTLAAAHIRRLFDVELAPGIAPENGSILNANQ